MYNMWSGLSLGESDNTAHLRKQKQAGQPEKNLFYYSTSSLDTRMRRLTW